jgi:hypothetical protein
MTAGLRYEPPRSEYTLKMPPGTMKLVTSMRLRGK